MNAVVGNIIKLRFIDKIIVRYFDETNPAIGIELLSLWIYTSLSAYQKTHSHLNARWYSGGQYDSEIGSVAIPIRVS